LDVILDEDVIDPVPIIVNEEGKLDIPKEQLPSDDIYPPPMITNERDLVA
jgi:hypothetical protein